MVLTRSGARREAVAEGQHAALLYAIERSVVAGASELEAALATIGPQGSPAVLASLAHGDHALLRAACASELRLQAVPPLLRAYGGSPEVCAEATRILEFELNLFFSCLVGRVGAVKTLLAAYLRTGRTHEALAEDDHEALRLSLDHPEVTALLLAEYGEPGCAPVLAALAAHSHRALRMACVFGNSHAVALLAAAYGPPGCDAFRGALKHKWIFYSIFKILMPLPPDYEATLAALLTTLGEHHHATAVSAMGAWLVETTFDEHYTPAQRLALFPPDSLLARLAAATPQAWALSPDAARALLSAPVRSSLALFRLLALRRLPGGVAEPVAAFLRPRPWLLYSSAAADLVAAAAPQPTA
jgi:hypothetical protein